LKDKLIEIKGKIKKLKENIENKHSLLKNSTDECEKIKVTLLNHYNKILKEGKDTR